MQQQALAMDCMLKAAGMRDSYKPSRWTSVRGQDLLDYNASMTTLFQTSFARADVIVGNIGLHYQKNFSTIGRSALVEHVTHFARAVADLVAPPAGGPGAGIGSPKARTGRSQLRFLWRQGTPQNFPTKNGWWPYYFNTCLQKCACTKLTHRMRDGNGTDITFSPRVEKNLVECNHPSESIHSIATSIIESHGLHVVKVYDALAAAPVNLHGGRGVPFDCTHWGVDALIFMNMAIIKDLLRF
jgi:hypothetical protein